MILPRSLLVVLIYILRSLTQNYFLHERSRVLQTRIQTLQLARDPSDFQNASILLTPCFCWLLKWGPHLSPELFPTLGGGEQTLARLCFEAVQWCRTSGRVFNSCHCEGCAKQPLSWGCAFALSLQSLPCGRRGLERGWAAPVQPQDSKWKYHFHRGVSVHWQVWGFVFVFLSSGTALVCSCLRFSLVTVLQPSLWANSRGGDGGWAQISAVACGEIQVVLVFLTTLLWTLLLFFVRFK